MWGVATERRYASRHGVPDSTGPSMTLTMTAYPKQTTAKTVPMSGIWNGRKDNQKKLEENLLEMAKIKEEKDKQLLSLEYVIGFTASVSFLILIFIASYLEMGTWLRILLIVVGSIIFAFGVGNALKIEQVAGYYECSDCHHKYVPTYQSVFWAPHMGRTRKMKCPNCGKKGWHKKVLK